MRWTASGGISWGCGLERWISHVWAEQRRVEKCYLAPDYYDWVKTSKTFAVATSSPAGETALGLEELSAFDGDRLRLQMPQAPKLLRAKCTPSDLSVYERAGGEPQSEVWAVFVHRKRAVLVPIHFSTALAKVSYLKTFEVNQSGRVLERYLSLATAPVGHATRNSTPSGAWKVVA